MKRSARLGRSALRGAFWSLRAPGMSPGRLSTEVVCSRSAEASAFEASAFARVAPRWAASSSGAWGARGRASRLRFFFGARASDRLLPSGASLSRADDSTVEALGAGGRLCVEREDDDFVERVLLVLDRLGRSAVAAAGEGRTDGRTDGRQGAGGAKLSRRPLFQSSVFLSARRSAPRGFGGRSRA